MYKPVGLFVVLIAFALNVGAQTIYQHATVITANQDTINGMVPLNQPFGKKLKIKNSNEEVAKLKIGLVVKVLTSHADYEPVIYHRFGVKQRKLMQVVAQGELILYRELELKIDDPETKFELENATVTRYVLKREQETVFISQRGFARKIVPMIHRVPGLVGKVVNKKFHYENLRDLVLEYNLKAELSKEV